LWINKVTYRHYETGQSLFNSVQNGCPICILIWNRMSEDARLGVSKGYQESWTHDASLVGSIWYSIIEDNTNISKTKGLLTIYMTYGYGPNEIPHAAVGTGEYPSTMVPKTVRGSTAAFFAMPSTGQLDLHPLEIS
jgi:hypothetical protein